MPERERSTERLLDVLIGSEKGQANPPLPQSVRGALNELGEDLWEAVTSADFNRLLLMAQSRHLNLRRKDETHGSTDDRCCGSCLREAFLNDEWASASGRNLPDEQARRSHIRSEWRGAELEPKSGRNGRLPLFVRLALYWTAQHTGMAILIGGPGHDLTEVRLARFSRPNLTELVKETQHRLKLAHHLLLGLHASERDGWENDSFITRPDLSHSSQPAESPTITR